MSGTNLKTISYLKHRAADLVRDIVEKGETVTITQNGEAKVVVMDVRTYDAWRRALAFTKLMSCAERDVARGRTLCSKEAFSGAEAAIRRVEDAAEDV